jgi:hypothetical protein
MTDSDEARPLNLPHHHELVVGFVVKQLIQQAFNSEQRCNSKMPTLQGRVPLSLRMKFPLA